MKYILVVLVTIIFSCAKVEILLDVPECIEEKIRELAKGGKCKSGASVEEYHFQNRTVYTFSEGNCGADFQTDVLDEQSNSLGALWGISGNKIINGENFTEHATFIGKVWGN